MPEMRFSPKMVLTPCSKDLDLNVCQIFVDLFIAIPQTTELIKVLGLTSTHTTDSG